MSKILIAPSILAADFAKLNDEIKAVEKAGCDMIHVDVMDGHFVPNISIGVPVVVSARKITKLPLDVHLMIENPQEYIKPFADAGSDIITIHAEACDFQTVVKQIKAEGKKAGVSLRPQTPLSEIKGKLAGVDMVLLMTVNPGFGGQEFMTEVLPKIKELKGFYKGDIQVDGGINRETARLAREAGANVLVAGTYVFKAPDIKKAIESLRK